MMDLKGTNSEASGSSSKGIGFISKMSGALLLSGKSFSNSYKSAKLWQGYLVSVFCSFLLSLVLSTSTFPPLMEIFPHFVFSITFFGITLWVSFSPLLLTCVFFSIISLWLVLSFLISYFKKLQIKRTASALGFAFSPLLILIFYLVNKFILQSFKYELGPLLLSIGIGWSFLSGSIGVGSLVRFEFGGLFSYSIKSIIFRRKRTYAAIIGIAVSIGLIVTPIPLISGYYSQLNRLAQQYQYAQYIIALEEGKNDYFSSYIDDSIISSLNHSNIQIISPETYLHINFSLNTSHLQFNLRGVNYSIFKNLRSSLSFQIIAGENFLNDQIILGKLVAQNLNISFADLPINVTLSYNSQSNNVTIIGLLNSDIYYDMEILAPISLTRNLKPELISKFSLIEIKLKDPSLIDSTLEILQSENPELEITGENQLSNFVSGIIERTINCIWLLSIVVYVTMGFGMFHVMQTIIRESEREIAILKSIGSNRFQLIRIFLYQIILLSLIGSIIGVLSGIFLSYIASFLVSNLTSITVRPSFDLFAISFAILLGLTSGILGGFYPVFKASRLKVGEIIR